MLTAILVDDEESNLSSLRQKLTLYCPQVQIAALCESGALAIESIDSLHPDLVFLDIEMPVMNGFVMLKQLKYSNFELIFTTAYDHYAIKAIKCSALDYLVKPVDIQELKEAVHKAERKKNNSLPNPQIQLFIEQLVNKKTVPDRIAIPASDGLQFINTDEIIYLEANINYTNIHCAGRKRFVASNTLKHFEDLLPGDNFIRIHNSYIINKKHAEKYIRGEGGQVILSEGTILDVSKKKKDGVFKETWTLSSSHAFNHT